MTLRTGHIGLNVTDLDRSLAFYRDVLGFGVIAEGKEEERRYAFLGSLAGDGHPGAHPLAAGTGAYDKARAGLHHLALEVDSVDRVGEYERALRDYGVDFAYEGVVAHREGSGVRQHLLPRPRRHPPRDLRAERG